MTRITQQMLGRSTLSNLQQSLSRTEKLQEQLSTGRALNRPSDSPTGLITAMQTRSSLASTRTQMRAADNAQGWLDSADSALQSAASMVGRVRDLVVQGANASVGPTGRENIAREIESIRDGLIDVANSSFGGRPIFGGTSDSPRAYDATGAFLGDGGAVTRTVADGVMLPVNVTGPEAFGPAGSSLFDLLTTIAADMRTDPTNVATNNLTDLDAGRDRLLASLGEIGARSNRLTSITERATSLELNLTQRLSEAESVDLPETIMELQMQEVAYQAALSATSRVIQPSLLDFLR